MRRGINKMLDEMKTLASRHPSDDEETWLKKLAELESQEERLLDLYLEGKLEVSRYETRVPQLKQSRKTIEEELGRIRDRASHIERLEHDRDALLSYYSQLAVERLDELEPEERNRIYRMLGLKVLAYEDKKLEAKWAFDEVLCGDNVTLPRWSSASTTHSFRFRASLTGEGNGEVELTKP